MSEIQLCAECAEYFCVLCEQPEPGRCKDCESCLCGLHYYEAVMNRRGVCASCGLPDVPEAVPDFPPVPAEEMAGCCRRGHLMTPDNTYEFPFGVFRCKLCKKDDQRELRASRSGGLPPAAHWNSNKHCCLRGHPFDKANTLVLPDGSRKCKECVRIRARRYYHAGQAAKKAGK